MTRDPSVAMDMSAVERATEACGASASEDADVDSADEPVGLRMPSMRMWPFRALIEPLPVLVLNPSVTTREALANMRGAP